MGTPQKLVVKSKIWIEDDKGGLVFGSGRLRMLEAIDRLGSILAASKDLNMSYRAVWGKLKATEERLGCSLLARQVGGAQGGGSELTPLAKELVVRFRKLESMAQEDADHLFQDFFAAGLRGDAGAKGSEGEDQPQ
jgi:molybdate transport system regulatory protein